MSKSKKITILIGVLFTFLLVLNFLSGKRKVSIGNSKQVKGIVTSVQAQKGLKLIKYTFDLDEKNYRGADLQNICVELSGRIVGKEFTVMYDKNDPSVSSILISKKSFDKYEVRFPDSLRWVIETCR